MTLTPEQLELQLACLHCGILWEGTATQVEASVGKGVGDDKNDTEATTIKQQLAALEGEDALRKRRRFRKLWRQHAKRSGIDPARLTSSASKRHFAYAEALRIYRAHLGLGR
jgi:hypothetical protein